MCSMTARPSKSTAWLSSRSAPSQSPTISRAWTKLVMAKVRADRAPTRRRCPAAVRVVACLGGQPRGLVQVRDRLRPSLHADQVYPAGHERGAELIAANSESLAECERLPRET